MSQNEKIDGMLKDPSRFKEIIFDKLLQKKSKTIEHFKMKEAARLSKEQFTSDINFFPLLEAGKLITSINYKGARTRHLQPKKGYIRQGTHYIPQTATQKILFRMSSKRRLRTINSKGAGFKRRIAFHMKLAFKRRKSMGLR